MTETKIPKRDLRIVLPEDAYERIATQAAVLAQSPASFGRQVIMEKVIALEAANAQKEVYKLKDYFQELEKRLEAK